MGVDFYYMPLSPPCRSALLAAKAFGIKLDCKLLNLMAGEHMKPDFLAINPQHHIPTINDNGFILWESRAIIQYFANSSPNGEHLYPKEPGKRALVDQRMYFDLGTLYERFYQFAIPFMFGREPALNPEKKAKVEEALSLLDGFIEKSGGWVAGDKMTIADFACVASVATIEVCSRTSFLFRGKRNNPNFNQHYNTLWGTTPVVLTVHLKILESIRQFL
ncbi:unnamed protein product [Notodromas monacha]|uniref:Glutathione transferase n=1 Tax=Notodromas monacha TaxID=399045 RepID=A0A7R9GDB4_9CRUS|nr:unnamed protein product [Notodromas monacha]CAG0916785.1 unnamed protein product [Notodromas monacha]